MPSLRALPLLLAALTGVTACGKADPGESKPPIVAAPEVAVKGIDTSTLTPRERREWSAELTELLAPCPEVPVSLAVCIQEARACKSCFPAAQLLLKQVQAGKTKKEREDAFHARFDANKTKQLPTDGSPEIGSPDAVVTIVEWADFECPYCRAVSPILDEAVKHFPGQVRLVFKFYPLGAHPHGEIAARAGVAAQNQGKFWEMHHLMFENQERLEQADLDRYAKQIGLDLPKYRTDLTSKETGERIEKEKKQADEVGLEGTPFVFINGRYVDFQLMPNPPEDLIEWIKVDIELAGKVPKVAPSAGWLGWLAEGAARDVRFGSARGVGGARSFGRQAREEGMKLADPCGCFPTGRHYPGIAHLMKVRAVGIASEFEGTGDWVDYPIAFIDTETTGRDSAADRLVEVGIVLGHRGQVTERRSWLINPGRPIPKETSAIHGITDDQVANEKSFAEVAGEIVEVLRNAIPAAYNAAFDRGFLLAELERAGVRPADAPPAMRREVDWIDPLTFARELYKDQQSRSLGDMAARLGIEMVRAHRATDDAEAALQVLYTFAKDPRVPRAYGGLVQEQRRLLRQQDEARKLWRKPS